MPIGDREKGSAREKEKQKDRPQDRQTDKDDTKAEIMFCCGIKMTFILNAIINQGSECNRVQDKRAQKIFALNKKKTSVQEDRSVRWRSP